MQKTLKVKTVTYFFSPDHEPSVRVFIPLSLPSPFASLATHDSWINSSSFPVLATAVQSLS